MRVNAMLGGKFRDKARVYCDTDVRDHKPGGAKRLALKESNEMSFTVLKMAVGIGLLRDVPGAMDGQVASVTGFLLRIEDISRPRVSCLSPSLAMDWARGEVRAPVQSPLWHCV